jgi:putative transposase
MCSSLGVSRSAYFQWRHHPRSDRDDADHALTTKIRGLHAQSRGTYGSPRVHRDLQENGIPVGRKRVERLMRQAEIRGLPRRRYVVTTESDHRLPVVSNLLQQDFRAPGPNRRWVGDITYISTHQGWLYLAVIMDLYSRRIVGWAMKDDLSTELALRALDLALSTRAPAEGLIHHSDRGCQYASQSYRQRLADHGIIPSMSRKACCYDNAAMESFFHTLKVELVRGRVFQTRELARAAIFEYIAVFYNRRRRHSAIGYSSPDQFEQQDFPAA